MTRDPPSHPDRPRCSTTTFGQLRSAGRYTAVAAVLVAASTCVGNDRGIVSFVADSIAAELLIGPPPVAGVVIAVRQGEEVLLDRAYGVAHPESLEPLEVDRSQRIASLTKQFTAAAILRLVDQGRMELDAPIQDYLPDFDTQGHTVTIRNLLNHTAGFRSYSALFAGTGRQPAPRAAVLDTLQLHPLEFTPGESYRYSNSNYYLLGVILEAVTGDSYGHHLQASLFDPLELEGTRYCSEGSGELLVGFRATADGLAGVELRDTTDYLGGSGGLCSTAGDLVRWQAALASGRVITPDAYRLMTSPTVLASGDTVPHGFGADIEAVEQHEAIAHGGSLAGFNGHMAHYPDADLSVAVLVNTDTPKAATVQEAVARAALGLARLVPTDLPLTARQRSRYVGTYDLGPVAVRVFEEAERLILQPIGQAPGRLLFQGEDVFFAEAGGGVRIEFQVEGDRATRLTLFQGAQRLEGERSDG